MTDTKPPRWCQRCQSYYLGSCQRCIARAQQRLNQKRQFAAGRSPIVYQRAQDAPPPDPRPA